jgi:sporulation related protein
VCYVRQLVNLRTTILIFVVLSLFIASCSNIIPGKTTSKSETYTEDLRPYWPEAAIPEEGKTDLGSTEDIFIDSATAEVTERLNTVLDTAAAYARSTIRYIDGFTIQVYGGDIRATAKDYRLDLLRNFPDSEPRMVFEQPNYKVRIGQYYTRLEAQHFFAQVKRVFPGAILIPTRIYFK